MDERARVAALTILGTTLLQVPPMYGVGRYPHPEDGRLVFAIGGGPSLITVGLVALTLGLAWVTARFLPIPAGTLFRVALVAFGLSLAIRVVGLTDWWVLLRAERLAAGQDSPQIWIDIPSIILALAAPLLFAIAGCKRLHDAPPSPRIIRRRTNQGLTLVELLVSVAIIALLLALIFPVHQAARRQAYAGNSVTNLRQIAVALAQYKEVEGGRPVSYAALMETHRQIVPIMHHGGDPYPEGFGNVYGECLMRIDRLPARSTYISLLGDFDVFIEDFERQGVRYAYFTDLSFARRLVLHPWSGPFCIGVRFTGKAIRAFPDTSVDVGRYGPVYVPGMGDTWCFPSIFSEEFRLEEVLPPRT